MGIIRLIPNETTAILELSERTPGTYYQSIVADGNALVSTLYVDGLSPGATCLVTFDDVGLSERPDDIVALGSHEIMTAVGVSKTSLTRFHNRPRVKALVTGGNVTFGLWMTLKSESISDIQFGLGATSVFTGATPTSGTIPIVGTNGKQIQQLSIRCAIDQSNSHRLLVSIDNGVNFIKLAPGEAFSVAPRGGITQILIGGNSHAVLYEIVILTAA